VHNANSAMLYNVPVLASELGIDCVLLASTVNPIGMGESANTETRCRPESASVFSKRPRFDYIPVDGNKHSTEKMPTR
jgi:hypothetical protein